MILIILNQNQFFNFYSVKLIKNRFIKNIKFCFHIIYIFSIKFIIIVKKKIVMDNLIVDMYNY